MPVQTPLVTFNVQALYGKHQIRDEAPDAEQGPAFLQLFLWLTHISCSLLLFDRYPPKLVKT